MLQNKNIETLRMLFSSHNYVMTTAELTASKLYYADIKQLLDEGLIERVRRGYYHWTQDYGESEVVIINRLFPDAVLCMETALFYYRSVSYTHLDVYKRQFTSNLFPEICLK